MIERLLTVPQIARRLRTSVAIAQLIVDRGLPTVTWGGVTWVRERDLDAAMQRLVRKVLE